MNSARGILLWHSLQLITLETLDYLISITCEVVTVTFSEAPRCIHCQSKTTPGLHHSIYKNNETKQWISAFHVLYNASLETYIAGLIWIYLNVIPSHSFMSVQRCWLLLYVPRRHSRGKGLFSLSGMFYICPKEKNLTFFQPTFRPFSRQKLLLRFSLILTLQ